MVPSFEPRMCFVEESPTLYASAPMQTCIETDRAKAGKRWVYDVLSGKKEEERELLRTDEFVLLPDGRGAGGSSVDSGRLLSRSPEWSQSMTRSNDWYPGKSTDWNQSTKSTDWNQVRSTDRTPPTAAWDRSIVSAARSPIDSGRLTRPYPPFAASLACAGRGAREPEFALHLLAIVTDDTLRCLRDLTGAHVGLLERLERLCMQVVSERFHVDAKHVLIFVNYPPSVYQLHFHVCAPFRRVASYDAFRMHSLTSILSNLRMNGEYYQRATLRVPVLTGSEFYAPFAGSSIGSDRSSEVDSSVGVILDRLPVGPANRLTESLTDISRQTGVGDVRACI